MSFVDVLKERNQLSINTDIDGMLSSAIVSKLFPNIKVEGYNNSNHYIWETNKVEPSNLLYIDFYCNDKETACIDQHINDADIIRDEELRFNPNRIIKHACLKNYTEKYPFGTVNFIIYLLEKNGFSFDINLEEKICEEITLGDLFLRADGTIYNTVMYKNNALEWMKTMCKGLGEHSLTRTIFLMALRKSKETPDVKEFQHSIEIRLKEQYNEMRKDGFNGPCESFFRLLENIYNAIGANINFEPKETLNKKYFLRYWITNRPERIKVARMIIDDKRIASFAFISSTTFSIQILEKNVSFIEDVSKIPYTEIKKV